MYLCIMKNCIICEKPLVIKQVKFCSIPCKMKAHYKKFKTNCNTTYSQFKRGYSRKIDLLNLLGGVCSKCGYNKNLSALNFHHLRDKSFSLDIRKISNTSLEKLKSEVLKCIILCANCHQEEHNPHCDIKLLNSTTGRI